MLVKNGEETKKSSAPRCCTPESGRGSIKTPHGTELIRYSKPQDIKNARSKYGEPSRLIQMYSIANVCFYFGITKGMVVKIPPFLLRTIYSFTRFF